MVAQSAEFKKAIEDSRSLSQTPTNDELLEVCIFSLEMPLS
jgi:acyl-CoA-binding protein